VLDSQVSENRYNIWGQSLELPCQVKGAGDSVATNHWSYIQFTSCDISANILGWANIS
jgi:hypothetical protein